MFAMLLALAPGADLFAESPTVSWQDLGLRTLGSLIELRALAATAPRRSSACSMALQV